MADLILAKPPVGQRVEVASPGNGNVALGFSTSEIAGMEHAGDSLVFAFPDGGTLVLDATAGNLPDFIVEDVAISGEDLLAQLGSQQAGNGFKPESHGDDWLFGGAGHDKLYVGGLADDALYGDIRLGNSDDFVMPASLDDTPGSGFPGGDWLSGGAGDEIVFGGRGNGVLEGAGSFGDGTGDVLYGGGSDFLYGGVDLDMLYGENDDILAFDAQNMVMDGAGIDFLVGASLDTTTLSAMFQNSKSVEVIVGENTNPSLTDLTSLDNFANLGLTINNNKVSLDSGWSVSDANNVTLGGNQYVEATWHDGNVNNDVTLLIQKSFLETSNG